MWEHSWNVQFIVLRKERIDPWVFVEEKRDISKQNEYKYKKIADDKIVRCDKRWIGNFKGKKTLLRKWCLVYA